MAHWKDAVVTNGGVEMLNEWMAGRKITIVAAYGGTGTVERSLLVEQTELVDMRQELHLLGEEDGAEGKTIQVQVQNTGVAVEYELNQVGVYAVLDADRDPDAEKRLLFIMQDEKGVSVPAAMDASFLLELYCMIGITNNGRFEVNVSAAGIVTTAYMQEALGQAIAAHNTDEKAHNGLAFRMSTVETELIGSVTIVRKGAPTAETQGVKGQHYINAATGEEFVCIDVAEDGYVWEPQEAAAKDLLARMREIEAAVNGGETIGGDGVPTLETKGAKGQHYIDRETGIEFVCTGVTEEGYTWEPWETADKSLFAVQPRLTGQPGQVVGFDAEGAAAAVRGWSNPNLLINWYFENPINRNGQTEYATEVSMRGTIDRWFIDGPTKVEILDGGIVLSATGNGHSQMRQVFIEDYHELAGQIITISTLTMEGILYTATGAVPNNVTDQYHEVVGINIPEKYYFACYIVRDPKWLYVAFNNPTAAGTEHLELKAVKVELGTVQTLAHQDANGNWVLNDPPNYPLQYALCHQYSPVILEWTGGFQHSNPNLLDNWYFAAPINQRGVSSYQGGGYTIDRWVASDGLIISLQDGWLKADNPSGLDQFFVQSLETDSINGIAGNKVSSAFLYKSGGAQSYFAFRYFENGEYVNVAFGEIPDSGGAAELFAVTSTPVPPTKSGWQFLIQVIPGTSLYLKAAKLEVGPVQTLAHREGDAWVLNDPPPSKALEMLKCQYELYVIDCAPGAAISTGISDSFGILAFPIQLPVAMRTTPALSTVGTIRVHAAEGGYTPVNFNGDVSIQGNIANLWATDLQPFTAYTLDAYPSGRIILDAER